MKSIPVNVPQINIMFLEPFISISGNHFKAVVLTGWESFYQESQSIIRKIQVAMK
jgi:hypothetical protein